MARPFKVRDGKAKFCSKACNASYNHKDRPKPKSRINIQKATDAIRGKPAWNRMPPTMITCEQCGRQFGVIKAREHTAHFCSRHCHNLHKKTVTGLNHPLYTRQPRKCEWCGKEVWVKPAKLWEFRFCSRACLGSWVCRHIHHPTTPEIIISNALKELRLLFETEYRIGTYSCDVVLPQYKVVIEIDGTYWHSLAKRRKLDKVKDLFLNQQGWIVLRFKEKDIYKNPSSCLIRLNKHIKLLQNS